MVFEDFIQILTIKDILIVGFLKSNGLLSILTCLNSNIENFGLCKFKIVGKRFSKTLQLRQKRTQETKRKCFGTCFSAVSQPST